MNGDAIDMNEFCDDECGLWRKGGSVVVNLYMCMGSWVEFVEKND